jgi:predicted phosphodiesterase
MPSSWTAAPSNLSVTVPFTRIFSDVHYGERTSKVRRYTQLRPLLDGVEALVLNGDTLDTRPSHHPQLSAEQRAETLAFFPHCVPNVTFLTGNHDADLSPHHTMEFADGRIFVTHGDLLFDNIVPWSRDSVLIARRVAEERAALHPDAWENMDERLALFRRVAISIPQGHQSERNHLKHALQFASDTVWPPQRAFRILRAWHELPARAAAFTQKHRPKTQFIILGHTHRSGVWRQPNGLIVINTGAFSPPFGSTVVDIFPRKLVVRRVEMRRSEFHVGAAVAEFALAEA